jgi:hypothetical protein
VNMLQNTGAGPQVTPATSDGHNRRTGLDVVLLGLLACTVVALGVAAFGNRAALPPAVQWRSLQWPDHTVSVTVLQASQRSRHIAHGDVVRLEIRPGQGATADSSVAAAFSVTLAPVRSRSHENLYLQRFRDMIPSLALEDASPAAPLKDVAGKASVQHGMAAQRPAAQACISRTGLVTADTAALLADIASWQATGPRARVMQFLGTAEPIPWDCVLVSISLGGEAGGVANQDSATILAQHWQAFITAWNTAKPWVQAGGAR